ncbi:MAG: hypothetical protein JWM86_2109 [Thermoleophilia bacterium]|nr:hypothetical protein [Thermoleophilia bacterium]
MSVKAHSSQPSPLRWHRDINPGFTAAGDPMQLRRGDVRQRRALSSHRHCASPRSFPRGIHVADVEHAAPGSSAKIASPNEHVDLILRDPTCQELSRGNQPAALAGERGDQAEVDG